MWWFLPSLPRPSSFGAYAPLFYMAAPAATAVAAASSMWLLFKIKRWFRRNWNYNGKVVVITGASSGIGKSMALQLALFGTKLVLSGRNETALKEVANEIKQLGSEALVVAGDLGDAQTIDRIVDGAIKTFKRIDALILGAGVSMGFRFEEMTDMKAARRIMEVNYFANVALTKKALPHLIQSRGRLAAITSGIGVVVPVATRTLYGASKCALQAFLESLRWEIESKHGVTITIVMPDTVKTNQNANRVAADGTESAKKFGWDLSKGYSPDFVARISLVGIQKGDREVAFDWPMTRILRSLVPNWIEWAGNISASKLTSK